MRKFYLSKEDLEGRFQDITDCPVARCLRRSGYPDAHVLLGYVFLSLDNEIGTSILFLNNTGSREHIIAQRSKFTILGMYPFSRPYFKLDMKADER